MLGDTVADNMRSDERLLGAEAGEMDSPKAQPTSRVKEMAKFLLTLTLVSRPGMWHFTFFMFIIPAAPQPSVLLTRRALSGLAFVVFPMNLMVYAMNDLKDVDVDATNPRKGGIHGAQASEADLQKCLIIATCFIVAIPPLLTGDLAWSTAWSAIGVFANWIYNFGPQLSRVPILDMFPPLAYLLVIPFSSKVLWGYFRLGHLFALYICFVVFRTQLWFQRMDVEADAKEGKRTTAVAVGNAASAVGVFGFLACEFAVASFWGCPGARVWTAYSACVFALELVLAKKEVTLALMAAGGFLFLVPFWGCLAAA